METPQRHVERQSRVERKVRRLCESFVLFPLIGRHKSMGFSFSCSFSDPAAGA